jgi:hypothetical protein
MEYGDNMAKKSEIWLYCRNIAHFSPFFFSNAIPFT